MVGLPQGCRLVSMLTASHQRRRQTPEVCRAREASASHQRPRCERSTGCFHRLQLSHEVHFTFLFVQLVGCDQLDQCCIAKALAPLLLATIQLKVSLLEKMIAKQELCTFLFCSVSQTLTMASRSLIVREQQPELVCCFGDLPFVRTFQV